jgi:hypothetical protein
LLSLREIQLFNAIVEREMQRIDCAVMHPERKKKLTADYMFLKKMFKKSWVHCGLAEGILNQDDLRKIEQDDGLTFGTVSGRF